VFTWSEDLSREARKLLARLRSLLKLRNLLRLESTGGLVRSGESEAIAVLLIGDSCWVSSEESRQREEEADEEEKNDEEENDEGDRGVEEQVDVESNLTLLTLDCNVQSKESDEEVSLLSVLTIITTHTGLHSLTN
jgi:hypothetical protein